MVVEAQRKALHQVQHCTLDMILEVALGLPTSPEETVCDIRYKSLGFYTFKYFKRN